MKKIFYIVMCIFILAATLFNVCFAYSNIDCVGCATMLFLSMEAVSAILSLGDSANYTSTTKKVNLTCSNNNYFFTMASRRIYVTIMVDIDNDHINEIYDELVDSITEHYSDNFECEGCEVETEVCDWTDKD